jgi:hypothetical protein
MKYVRHQQRNALCGQLIVKGVSGIFCFFSGAVRPTGPELPSQIQKAMMHQWRNNHKKKKKGGNHEQND